MYVVHNALCNVCFHNCKHSLVTRGYRTRMNLSTLGSLGQIISNRKCLEDRQCQLETTPEKAALKR
jgi:hypothetical protein